MSNAIFNRVGQDSMECELITFGNNVAECYLDRDLLDGTLNYHFGITSLSVPLNKIPIHPVSVDTPIIQLKRRNPGAALNVADYASAPIYNEFAKIAENDPAKSDEVKRAEMFLLLCNCIYSACRGSNCMIINFSRFFRTIIVLIFDAIICFI